ncbi:hypothetical protein [Chryseobacterium sp. WLY505]|uniref:hypothetical protein n=1 Tax=Chryseobacterium sp. WLY505 TaxID=3068892 RepID=UPI0027964AF7|nr:hypothetical protein [Chryseobacterium sp. WLY505]MDQ1855717.1 hypothetical protein [Chryseobacterium sp. WLY505]
MRTNVRQMNPINQTKGQKISQQRAEKIARNINAMDMDYQRSDDMNYWKFWSDLEKTLKKKISELSPSDIEVIKPMLKPEEAKYFNLI